MMKGYFGGGCFWCTEAVFYMIKGVVKIVPGYAGGQSTNPTYKEICSGLSGHAELIMVEYDENLINYKDLLLVFFSSHDPTTLNRQGNDVGTQYRSIIFYNTEQEKKDIEEFISSELPQLWPNPAVTEVVPLDVFYPAEAYHHEYYRRNSAQGYCQMVISPKLNKLKKNYPELLHE